MEHWERLSLGVEIREDTPEDLWRRALDYFRWCRDNPIQKSSLVRVGKDAGEELNETKTRPYTIKALCLHCGITERYLRDICEYPEEDNPWYIVGTRILYIIHTQIVENALLNEFSPTFSSKILGLDNEKPETKHRPVRVEVVSAPALSTSESEAMEGLPEEIERN